MSAIPCRLSCTRNTATKCVAPQRRRGIGTDRADDGAYDVLLIDQLLDGPYNGIELMRKVKAEYPEIESIIFTGFAQEHRRQALQSGAFLVVDKARSDVTNWA